MYLQRPKFEIMPHLAYEEMLALVCRAIHVFDKTQDPVTPVYREVTIKARLENGIFSFGECVGFSVVLTVDRGMAQEFSRHGIAHLIQENPLYCDYSKAIFGSQVSFIMPNAIRTIPYIIPEGPYEMAHDIFKGLALKNTETKETRYVTDLGRIAWFLGLKEAEEKYLGAVKNGLELENASGLLPSATKAEVVITANMREWGFIFETHIENSEVRSIVSDIFISAKRLFPAFFSHID